MTIVGFNFDRLSVERKGIISQKMKISNNINIKSIDKEDLYLGPEKKKGAKFNFEFSIDYEPKIGNVTINGHILYYDDPKKIDEIVSNWSKNKKIIPEISTPILNLILGRCNLKALFLAQEVNLPPHLQMPRVKPKDSSSDYIK